MYLQEGKGRFTYIIISILMALGAIIHGYYSEVAFLTLNIVLMSLLIVVFAYRKMELRLYHLFIILFVAAYWLSVVFAVDREQAILETSRVTGLIPFSLLLTTLSGKHLKKLIFQWPWIGSVIVGIGVVFQMYRNGRLEATFYYANAIAIFLLVNILLSILAYLQQPKKTYILFLTINATGLLLTFSRSVWVLWFVAVAVMIAIFPSLRKIRPLCAVAMGHFFSLLLAIFIKQDALFFIHRLSTIQTKTSEFQIRLVYWKDSFGMIRDYWWGGTAGGGWNVLQHLYQSQAYFVKYIHNHYLQVALDIGVFGLAIFLCMVGGFYVQGWRIYRKANQEERDQLKGIFIVTTCLLLHAGFDFDITYPFLFMVLMILLVYPGKVEAAYNKTVNFGKTAKITTLPLMVALILFMGWMLAGYGYLLQGKNFARQNQLPKALEAFQSASQWLPWSTDTLYQTAKVYVRLGNETQDSKYYHEARERLIEVRDRVPEQMLYRDLLNEINQALE